MADPKAPRDAGRRRLLIGAGTGAVAAPVFGGIGPSATASGRQYVVGLRGEGGVLPDLRRSGFLPHRQAWESVVLDGLLRDRGMAGFATNFDREDVESIRAYVAHRAVQSRGQEVGSP